MNSSQTVGIFLDGKNLEIPGIKFNYGELKNWIANGREIEEINYFSSCALGYQQKLGYLYKLIKANGYSMHLREPIFIRPTNKIKQNGVDAALIIKAIERLPYFDVFILGSGDSDFLPLIEYMDERGKDVEIIASGDNCHSCYKKYKLRYLENFLKTQGVKEFGKE
jgi:uncharacterized LabA/DUF88 family protein